MLPFPQTFIGRVAWLSSAAAAVTACVFVGLTVREAAPLVLGLRAPHEVSDSDIRVEPVSHSASAIVSEVLSEAVRVANAEASSELDQRMAQCKSYMVTLVDRDGISAFVAEVTSYTQKLHQLANLLGGKSGEERLHKAFRDLVVDCAELGRFVDATVDGYEVFLDEQDREILRAAGVVEMYDLADIARPTLPDCRRLVEPIIRLAGGSARNDIGRTGFVWVSGAVAGYAANRAARATGLNEFEEGSFGDLATQTGISIGAEQEIDNLTDPTERLIALFTREIGTMTYTLFFGDQGVGNTLHFLKAEHERARAQLLSNGPRR
jgi:hypothetical protein